MADARNFLINSDYPLDKVIFLGEATYTNYGSFFSFNHGLPFTPLIKLTWSLDPSFNTVYGVGGGPTATIPLVAFDPSCGAVWATSTQVFAQFTAYTGTAAIYIRMYAFEPYGQSNTLPASASGADNFTINSEYNYSKLLDFGVTNNSSTPNSVEIIPHNLGYYPQVEAWYELPGKIQSFGFVNPGDAAGYYSTSVEITTTSLVFRRDPYLTNNQRFHYRIYADEL